MTLLADRLDAVKARIAAAAARSGREAQAVRLIAVSKSQPIESVREAFEAGQRVFGENRVQELAAKAPLGPGGIEWHLIGHLQGNKIRKALPLSTLIHGVDSLNLAQDIDRVAVDLGLFPRFLVEVNVSGEGTKFGFEPAVLEGVFEHLLALPRAGIEGLMTIAPLAAEPGASRPHFARLRDLRDRLAARFAVPLPVLSMGMSGDFEVAIEEGATLVRVGTAIFGGRGD